MLLTVVGQALIRFFPIQKADTAKDYFSNSLERSDYYIEDLETVGELRGNISKRLGIKGQKATKEIFNKLCDNINPMTGRIITQRMREDRLIGNDISFHCPKSVSVALGLSGNEKIKQAIDSSVYETMLEIEQNMYVRVRPKGRNEDAHTGEMIWCDFPHWTSRSVMGYAPDPHYHIHCIAWNITFSSEDEKFKAGKFFYIKKNMPYYQARFQKRLADKLSDLGCSIRKTKNAFEICEVPQKAIDYFSKRTNHINRVAKERNITHPKALAKLGGITRTKKERGLTLSDLQENWQTQIEENDLKGLPDEKATQNSSQTPESIIEYTLSHGFENRSVKTDKRLLELAYLHAIDNPNISIEQIDKAFDEYEGVFKQTVSHETFCTTRMITEEEQEIISLARQGIGSVSPLSSKFSKGDFNSLNDEQQTALHRVMTTKDRLVLIKGSAGTGKTTLLKSVVPEVEKTNTPIRLFAPTAQASREVLRNEGFDNAETLAKLLKDKAIQSELKDGVIWVDEAGLIGNEDMLNLLRLVKSLDARLVLSGDTAQHSPVKRGNAMELMQTLARIPYVRLKTIFRQKDNDYKEAISALSEGNVHEGFTRLDKMGAIIEKAPEQIDQSIVQDYMDNIKNKKSVLVVTPSKNKVRHLNKEIQQALIKEKKVSKDQRAYITYHNQYFTFAEKQDSRNYRKGMVIQTHQNMKGLPIQSVVRIVDVECDYLCVQDNNSKLHKLNYCQAEKFDIYETDVINFGKGDQIRMTKNSVDNHGKKLSNGSKLTVIGFTRDGNIKLASDKANYFIPKTHGNYELAYCATSYSAQGKTVERVIIAQPGTTFMASDKKQFYVSASRARESIAIYTDDKEELLNAVSKSLDDMPAMELLNQTEQYLLKL
jgi:conjugative relaxase-like TrwC/TraI family protein